MTDPTVAAKPWYRQFWPWFVLAPLIATVIGGFATLIIAGAPPPLVVDDFGQIAMAVEQDQKRDRRAAELGLVAQLQFLPDPNPVHRAQAVRVSLAGDSPQSLRLQLIHPTRDDLDRRFELERTGDSFGAAVDRPATRVYIQLTDTDDSWRLTGEINPEQQFVELRPRAAPRP